MRPVPGVAAQRVWTATALFASLALVAFASALPLVLRARKLVDFGWGGHPLPLYSYIRWKLKPAQQFALQAPGRYCRSLAKSLDGRPIWRLSFRRTHVRRPWLCALASRVLLSPSDPTGTKARRWRLQFDGCSERACA
jgi:hypothetical protein